VKLRGASIAMGGNFNFKANVIVGSGLPRRGYLKKVKKTTSRIALLFLL
jgi:hypothetical protein